MSGGVHLRDLAFGQANSEETSQRWRAVGDTAFELSSPGIIPRPPAPITMRVTPAAIPILNNCCWLARRSCVLL